MTESRKRTILQGARGEYTEKKSRFIADVFYVTSEADTEDRLARIRKEFYDARHHCSAFILLPEGSSVPIMRSSDDGEPQGTAGHPMLDLLKSESLVNAMGVVTRYFGGTLLGTGGLVRSYTYALKDALAHAVIIERKNGIPLSFTAEYGIVGKIDYFLAKEDIPVLAKSYSTEVSYTILLAEENAERFMKELTSLTSGKMPFTPASPIEYAVRDGVVLTGDALIRP